MRSRTRTPAAADPPPCSSTATCRVARTGRRNSRRSATSCAASHRTKRGFGRSTRGPLPTSLLGLADDAVRLCAELGVDRAHVVGPLVPSGRPAGRRPSTCSSVGHQALRHDIPGIDCPKARPPSCGGPATLLGRVISQRRVAEPGVGSVVVVEAEGCLFGGASRTCCLDQKVGEHGLVGVVPVVDPPGVTVGLAAGGVTDLLG
jgi:hypothetical protein